MTSAFAFESVFAVVPDARHMAVAPSTNMLFVGTRKTTVERHEQIEIRAIVSPQRKGFWRRLMEAFIPRPTQATPQPTASR